MVRPRRFLPSDSEYVDQRHAAVVLGVSTRYVRMLCRKGVLEVVPGVRTGGKKSCWFRRSDVERLRALRVLGEPLTHGKG